MSINCRAEKTEPRPSFRKRIFRKLLMVTASTILQNLVTGILFGHLCDSGTTSAAVLLVLLFVFVARAE